jgi:signal transduction histidine kinase
MSSSNFETLLMRIRQRRRAVTALAFGGGLVLAGLIASRITRPIDALRVAAQRIAKGELDVPLPARAADDEIGALVRAFHEMVAGLRERASLRQKLEAAERDALLGRIAAMMAHDVRNPLNYLSLAVGHLLAAPQSTPENAAIGEQIKRELQRANDRIGEFLRLGKPVEVHPREVPVRSILESVAASCSPPGNPVTVTAGDETAWWDPVVVEGIVRNLVTNAVQATGGTGAVSVAATRAGAVVRVVVDDDGPGIDPAVPLFEPWFTTKEGGVGLGLALARRSAREHGGDLRAESRERGARFVLELPADARAPA